MGAEHATRLRVAVVGCGIGQAHVRAYQSLPDQFDVVAICDVDLARAQAMAAQFAIPRVCGDLADLCRMDDLDVVDICTPSHLHAAQAEQALAADKHVVLEKPIAGSLREADALIAAEARSGRRLMPIFQYRFGHGLRQLRFLVDEGVAGRAYLTTVETAWRRRAAYYAVPWRGKWQTELGGPLVTLAIHAHDALYSILGPARSAFARAATRVNPIETEDCLAAALEMADGSLASLAVTTGSATEVSRHRFCFSNLVAESNARPYANTAAPWSFTGDTPEQTKRIEQTLARFVPQPEGYVGQFAGFYQAVQDGAPLPVTLADGRASLELITALYHSVRTGELTQLPIGPDHPGYGGWRGDAVTR